MDEYLESFISEGIISSGDEVIISCLEKQETIDKIKEKEITPIIADIDINDLSIPDYATEELKTEKTKLVWSPIVEEDNKFRKFINKYLKKKISKKFVMCFKDIEQPTEGLPTIFRDKDKAKKIFESADVKFTEFKSQEGFQNGKYIENHCLVLRWDGIIDVYNILVSIKKI